MSLILLVSIALRMVALAWTLALSRRFRDARLLLLALMFSLMATRQTLTLVKSWDSWSLSVSGHLSELPGLAVSVLALTAVVAIGQGRAKRARIVADRTEMGRRLQTVMQATTDFVGWAMPDGQICLLYTSPSPRDREKSRMPSSA